MTAVLPRLDAAPVPSALDGALAARLATLDIANLRRRFLAQNEFVTIEELLPAQWLTTLLSTLPALAPHVHRNYIPRHKKGGSIGRFDLDRHAPAFGELYRAPALLQFLSRLTGQSLLNCPGDDSHSYALYYYTEPGDHIGYHYDTSYYHGARYTILFGLVDESSCRLEYQLYRDDPMRATREESVALSPGTFVIFNGDHLYHRVTPLAPGERRIALTLEYVTCAKMHPLRRFVSNMKDAIAYFGFRQTFRSWLR